MGKRSWLKANALSVVSFAGFLIFLILQAIAGWNVYNSELEDFGRSTVSFGHYLGSGHFGEAVFENWESEFLQMGVFVVLTAYLVQRGSAESKKLNEPKPASRGGWQRKIYENSLAIALFGLFILSLVSHLFTGVAQHNKEQALIGKPAISVGELFSSDFWFQSMQNWQSEFLAVGCLVVFTIFLRQKGSPQSKPVTAPHSQTGEWVFWGKVSGYPKNMSVIEKSIEVDVPIKAAYNQWTQFEAFPKFMEGVERVDQLSDTRTHWKTKIAGVSREFDAEITRQEPDELIEWRSVDGPDQMGAVTFQPVGPGRTLVNLAMHFRPEGVAEKIGDATNLVERRVEGDLERFKEFIESRGGAETGEWRGTV